MEHEEWSKYKIGSDESKELVKKCVVKRPIPYHTISLPLEVAEKQKKAVGNRKKCIMYTCDTCKGRLVSATSLLYTRGLVLTPLSTASFVDTI